MSGAHVRRFALDTETQELLQGWFAQYQHAQHHEIEARIKNLTKEEFDRMKHKLDKNTAWANTPTWTVVEDSIYAKRLRVSQRVDPPDPTGSSREVMRKEPVDRLDREDYRVRFSVNLEEPLGERGRPPGLPDTIRRKRRISYNHKNLFVFDLTEVQQAESMRELRDAPTTYEVEVEYKGQAKAAQNSAITPKYLAESFAMKVQDLVACLADPAAAGAAAAGGAPGPRAGAGPHGLAEGTPVVLVREAPVRLEYGVGTGEGEYANKLMPFEDARRVDWMFSHASSGDGQSAFIMSFAGELPSGHVFPVHFYGGYYPLSGLARVEPTRTRPSLAPGPAPPP
eukprot:tig00000983_g5908.t1